MRTNDLPIPDFFDPRKVEGVWRVPYAERAAQAEQWAKTHALKPAASDQLRVCLMAIDVQNTFCQPDFELFVAGRNGRGAVDDNIRLCQFIYRNLDLITQISPTMDTHLAMQIFHPMFWVDDRGEHPIGNVTTITLDDVQNGVWRVNPAVAGIADGNYVGLQQHALHYVRRLTEGGRYPLLTWTYHAMLGGIGHALVSVVEEALFFHCLARKSQTGFEIKGGNPLSENYSVLRPEVLDGYDGQPIAQKNTRFLKRLLNYDVVIVAGQAKSHCVAWTINDLLEEIMATSPELVSKVYLVEDLSSAVTIPGVVDFTDQADDAYDRFRGAGMHVVKSTDPIVSWEGVSIN